MTRAEFYEKYGDVKVKFYNYYKYTFNYYAELPDGKRLTCGYGGSHDEIYRHKVSPDAEETIKSLHPYTGSVYENGVEAEVEAFVEGFYDF